MDVYSRNHLLDAMTMNFAWSLVLISCLPALVAGYVLVPARNTGGATAELEFSTRNAYNTVGYLGVVGNPVGHFHVYSSLLSNGTCGGYEKTSAGASAHTCLLSMNGGPFVEGRSPTSETCLGHVISDDVTRWSQSTLNANFGLTKNGSFVLGQLTDQDIQELQFQQLITGFGVLVQDGKIIPSPGGEVAPRTAIGVDAKGQLMLLEVDGVERDTPPKGLTTRQAAEWMLEAGAVQAVNLDGGGSSVTVYKGEIVSKPSCIDIPVVCERAVTTFTCII